MDALKKIALFAVMIVLSATSLKAEAFYPVARPDSQVIRSLLVQRDKEIKDLLGPKGTKYTTQQREKLKKIINDIVDFRAMAKVALQKTYDTLSTKQRNDFVDVFSKIIKDQSLNKLDIYRAKIEYKKISVKNDTARVETIAALKDVQTPVTYKMAKGNGKWYIIDFSIDNVSTAQSYERSFQSFIPGSFF